MSDRRKALGIAVLAVGASMAAAWAVLPPPRGEGVTPPRDGRGWALLARQHMDANRFGEAAQAYEKALAASPKVARDAQVWCELADALGMAQGGRLAGKPRAIIERAIQIQPDHPCALEMAGSAAYEAGDRAATLTYWEPLLARLEPGSARHTELALAVARVKTERPK